jgi:hypothetical protein
MESDLLTDRQKAAVLWAEHVTNNTARSRDDVFEIVQGVFNQAEIVELTLMSAFFAFFNRVTDSLKIPVEIPAEVDLIKHSLHLDPDKVRTYFDTLSASWPTQFPEPSSD